MNINKFYINGNFVEPNGSDKIDLINPATEEKVGYVVTGTEHDVDAAVNAAKSAFNQASLLTLDQKKVILQEIIDGMQARKEEIAQVISEEMGAPIKVARSAQFGSGLVHFINTLKVIDDFSFNEVHDNITINKLPIGPVGMITPWNWPLNQMLSLIHI